MEFRIFLPMLLVSDQTWIPIKLFETYMNNIMALTAAFPSGIVAEKREDSYLVGSSSFGIKHRSGKKVEIKVRTSAETLPISKAVGEEWKKVKYGKKELSKYTPDILELLGNLGYFEYRDVHAQMIAREYFIAIDKTRHEIFTQTPIISGELCSVKINLRSSTSNDQLIDRDWISIAIEGSPIDIDTFLTTNLELHGMIWGTSFIAHQIACLNLETSMRFLFIPLNRGYPTWIRLIGQQVEIDEVQNMIDGFLEFLMTIMNLTKNDLKISSSENDLIFIEPVLSGKSK